MSVQPGAGKVERRWRALAGGGGSLAARWAGGPAAVVLHRGRGQGQVGLRRRKDRCPHAGAAGPLVLVGRLVGHRLGGGQDWRDNAGAAAGPGPERAGTLWRRGLHSRVALLPRWGELSRAPRRVRGEGPAGGTARRS
eukprot:11490649-Alexandrium_andersonii.AAC.1